MNSTNSLIKWQPADQMHCSLSSWFGAFPDIMWCITAARSVRCKNIGNLIQRKIVLWPTVTIWQLCWVSSSSRSRVPTSAVFFMTSEVIQARQSGHPNAGGQPPITRDRHICCITPSNGRRRLAGNVVMLVTCLMMPVMTTLNVRPKTGFVGALTSFPIYGD